MFRKLTATSDDPVMTILRLVLASFFSSMALKKCWDGSAAMDSAAR